jgi:PilZ domain-containing protein
MYRSMTRRKAVRILLFERARLVGGPRGVRCAIIDLSAVGALLTLTAAVPPAPLRLEFELGGERLKLEVEVKRAAEGKQVAVAFIDPPVDRLHRLIAVEQRQSLAKGRINVYERRTQRRGAGPRGGVPLEEPDEPAG